MNAELKTQLVRISAVIAGVTASSVLWRMDHNRSPLDWATARGNLVGGTMGFLVVYLFQRMRQRPQRSAADSG